MWKTWLDRSIAHLAREDPSDGVDGRADRLAMSFGKRWSLKRYENNKSG